MTVPELPDRLHVALDSTPGVHRTDSDDMFWRLPILGPTATVLAWTLARNTAPAGTSWDTVQLAERVGLVGNLVTLSRTLQRLDQFRVARFHSTDVLTIRMWLPALTERHFRRLPADMAAAYPYPPVQEAS
jgi:hypothetical protein